MLVCACFPTINGQVSCSQVLHMGEEGCKLEYLDDLEPITRPDYVWYFQLYTIVGAELELILSPVGLRAFLELEVLFLIIDSYEGCDLLLNNRA